MDGASTGVRSCSFNMSHAELDGRARRVASGLEAFGVKEGDCVVIFMRNDIPFFEASYATMLLGAYAVPLNWHFKAEEVEYVLNDCQAKVVIGHSDLINSVKDGIPADIKVITVTTPAEILSAYHIDPKDAEPALGALDYEVWLKQQALFDRPSKPAPLSMLYTSGTTGHPKGVRRFAPTPEQERKTDNLRAAIYGVKPGIRALVPGPLYHSAPNGFGLRAGKVAERVVLMPRFDAEELLRLIEEERIDTIFMVPTMFIRLLKLPEDIRNKYDTSSLRYVFHAAAPCPADVKKAMIDWWGNIIWEFYGGTETGPITWISSEEALKKPGSAGRVTEETIIQILDDNKQPVAQGEIGEIFARIPYYPDFTYHNLDHQRKEVDHNGLVTLGDMGYFDEEGYLFICDRKRDMVISGGVNIYPAEIEAVLHAAPGVRDCAVFGVPDEEFGEALMAVIEPQASITIDIGDMRSYLGMHLANYKVPKAIEIRPTLPRDDSGKIYKRRLREPYWHEAGRRI